MMPKNKKGNKNEEVEILDLGAEEVKTPEPWEEPKEEKENIFRRLKNKWDDLTTRTKTIIIVIFLVLVVGAISTVLFFVLTKEQPKKTSKKDVIVAKDNYRYEDGTLYFVVNHKDIGSYECKNKDKNLCYVAYENPDDEFDETKYINDEDSKVRSKILKNKYVFVFDNEDKKDDNLILYDIKNKKDLGTYKNIKTYENMDNVVFALNDENKYGALDFSAGKDDEALNFTYDYLGVVTENKKSTDEIIVAKENDGSYLMDLDGKKLTSILTGKIKNYNDKYVKVVDAAGKYFLYDYEGNKIAENLNYIDLLDEYYLTVNDENKLGIMGYDQTKYLEEGLELHNTNYVPTVNKKKTSKDAKEYAYTYSLEGTDLTIKINNEGKEEESKINLLEGLASKNYKYISYYNGALYFYSDEAKTTLINSYICNNPNKITAPDGKFETCNLAGDTIENDNETNEKYTAASIIPIYSNRYVFVKDDNIVNLVDLTDEKVKGTYNSVNTFSDATKTEPYVNSPDIQYVIAKNRNNKYGLLKMTPTSVVSLYNFEYDKLEPLHQNILAKKGDTTFLLDYNGNKITYEFKGQIRNYNGEHVKVLNDGKYYIFDFGGNLTFEDGYKYVELYDDFVGLVDDANQLSVVDYDGNRIIKQILKLSSTTYYNAKDDYVPAFSMRKEDNRLIITAATSQNTKKEKAKEFIYDLRTKERIN